ncbi:MAG TPA: hypothetical protein PKY30_05825 [Myxococcota bacterium]|nr:hypothetical protein [Myxococcota bacterium]HND32072.1 hypothetical protein [Myxococcota bacterium]HNH46533.1 hypothetical protein [Myxococcota bacterium]
MFFLLLSLACGYRNCGSLEYYTYEVNADFDDNQDNYLDLQEACGVDYGSWGSNFPDVGLVSFFVDYSEWDTHDSGTIAYDYLPLSEIVFLADHLSKGTVLGMEQLGGYGFHKPGGAVDYVTTSWPLTEGSLEVLDGPRENDYEGTDYKLSFRFVIGTPDDQATRGYQVLEAEDWFNFSDSLWAWDSAGHAYAEPPDYTAGG